MKTPAQFFLIVILAVSVATVAAAARDPVRGNRRLRIITSDNNDDAKSPLLHARLSPKFLPFLAQSTLFVLSREFRRLVRIPDTVTRVDVPVIGKRVLP